MSLKSNCLLCHEHIWVPSVFISVTFSFGGTKAKITGAICKRKTLLPWFVLSLKPYDMLLMLCGGSCAGLGPDPEGSAALHQDGRMKDRMHTINTLQAPARSPIRPRPSPCASRPRTTSPSSTRGFSSPSRCLSECPTSPRNLKVQIGKHL